LVVIAIILVLAAIGVMFVPSVQDGDKAAGGARQLMGMLQIAKTRAMRDQAPRGVRLLANNPSAASPGLLPTQITELQYIEQPPDFYDKTIGIIPFGPSAPRAVPNISFLGDLSGGLASVTPPVPWPVQAGDYLEINGGGLLYRIMGVNPTPASSGFVTYVTLGFINTIGNPGKSGNTITVSNTANISPGMSLALIYASPGASVPIIQQTATVYTVVGTTLTLSPLQPSPLPPTFYVQNDPPLNVPLGCPYRIIRSPRPVAGEDGLTLPVDVAIQLSALDPTFVKLAPYDPPLSSPPPPSSPPPAGTVWFDILFSPSGALVGSAAGNDKVILWVRDVTQPNVTDNNPVLVCIYTRSGLIAAHPVDVTPGGNPYSFTVDGRSSGE